MITLKTLPEATAQEVFDQVASHLLAQNQVSSKNNVCAYRGDNSLKCAAGCLIADDEYNSAMGNLRWHALIDRNMIPPTHQYLISELQDVHDLFPPDEWKERLERVANQYELTWNF